MSTKEEEFIKQLQATFRIEAAEHLQVIATGLLELEKMPDATVQRNLVETTFRAAHSLKGAARAVDFTEIESQCQSLEDIFASWKRQENAPPPATFDTAHRTLNAINTHLSTPEVAGGSCASVTRLSISPSARQPEVSAEASPQAVAQTPGAENTTLAAEETVRIADAKLDMRMMKTGAILLAEDSITSRLRIKNILESAGYQVTTAVDGMEAFTMLRTEKFDLVISDVEMPRLNGFDLTARIRADKKLMELPVVLVTALEMREHRERGINIGANAYLVKSNCDQSKLLEAVRRLI